MAYKVCSRCGGTGLVSKGQVINGVCYGCNGSGRVFVGLKDATKPRKGTQYVIVNREGHHVALNTDRALLEAMLPQIPDAVGIEELPR